MTKYLVHLHLYLDLFLLFFHHEYFWVCFGINFFSLGVLFRIYAGVGIDYTLGTEETRGTSSFIRFLRGYRGATAATTTKSGSNLVLLQKKNELLESGTDDQTSNIDLQLYSAIAPINGLPIKDYWIVQVILEITVQ